MVFDHSRVCDVRRCEISPSRNALGSRNTAVIRLGDRIGNCDRISQSIVEDTSARGRHLFLVVSASVWIALLFLFRDDLDQAVVEVAFGHSISMGLYLIGFSLLTLIVGFVSSFLGAASREDEELTASLLMVPSHHWLWLWMAGSLWIGMLPIVAYYIWLQFATALYSIIHPSLWFQEGTDLFLGSLGIAALFIGIDISLKAVSDKRSYGGVVWKRVLTFLAGSLVLASLVAPVLLNIDINRMKDMPASLGSHPWWIL